MPALGLGSSAQFGGYGHEATVCALKDCGMRLLDTAARYGTEESIGKAIKDSGIPRKDLFVVTKLWFTNMGYESGKKALQASLKALGLEYVDLYLIHWPVCPDGTADPVKCRQETWKAMEESYEAGLCKAIGVSNYEISHYEELKAMKCKVMPQAAQLEFHVMQDPNREIIKYCRDNNIVMMAYSPYAAGKAFALPKVKELAEKYKKTAGQIMLRWIVQHGIVPIPKTAKVERAKENAQVFDFELSKEDMAVLDSIHKESSVKICEAPS
ncbi:9,11-endoperoxide prostaglandin H2 reductase-like [Amphiura filiformis]|uniref:9,11-endoperoxide prostaglandin H2 reductase-like n=1 Tax=Amphiura filiformis TaxID=82378 RepID=UPI003B211D25